MQAGRPPTFLWWLMHSQHIPFLSHSYSHGQLSALDSFLHSIFYGATQTINMFKKRRLGEFFLVGLFLGLVEDILAIYFSTGVSITWHTVFIALIIALPFAVFSELIVDRMEFSWKRGKK